LHTSVVYRRTRAASSATTPAVEVAQRSRALASAAEARCRHVLAARPVDSLVDWQFVESNLLLLLPHSAPPHHHDPASSAGTDDAAAAAVPEQLAGAFREELCFPAVQSEWRRSHRAWVEEAEAEEGGAGSSCSDRLAATLLALLRSPVPLSAPSPPRRRGGGGKEGSDPSDDGGAHMPASAAAGALCPRFRCSPPRAGEGGEEGGEEGGPSLEASLWPAPSLVRREVSLLARAGLRQPPALNRSPFSIPARLPLEELCILSEMLQSAEQFVTHRGALVGLVTREGLLATLRDMVAEK
jgi:hypothetical protein